MNEKLKCIMLIDDDNDDNFFHEIAITKSNFAGTVLIMDSGAKALAYIKSKKPPCSDLIFLDINMPRMTGWDFLEEYKKLDENFQKGPVIVMLSTSFNKTDIAKSMASHLISDYITKPLTKELLEGIVEKYFN